MENIRGKYAPIVIDKLERNEVFVFGSNINGHHHGGAAKIALDKFGAVWGQGVGLQGQSYAIPTMQGDISTIKPYVDDFIIFARNHSELIFLVTRIGCGKAGFNDKEMAPLFMNALGLSNILLPKQFVEEMTDLEITVPKYMKNKIYGQTRTLVDMIIELNKMHHYRSYGEVLRDLNGYLEKLRTEGNTIAFNCSVRSLYIDDPDWVSEGKFDTDKLLQKINNEDWYRGIDEVYKNYALEKTIKLIEYLNEFRRYSSPMELYDDFMEITGGVNHCGPSPVDYYFSFGSPSGGYIYAHLTDYLKRFWNEIAPEGILNNQLFHDVMIGRHERELRKYGLDVVISQNYREDSACHPEVLLPQRGWVGPVYVREGCYVNDNGKIVYDAQSRRRYIKSCGEGKGPNAIMDFFEMNLIKKILKHDRNYMNKNNFYLPVSDYTLPVFSDWYGMILFDNQTDKELFIKQEKDA